MTGSFLLYAQTLDYPFQFDDRIFLEDGNVLAAHWSRFLWPPVPRALIWLSFTAQIALHPQLAALFRIINVTLHGLNAFLLFLLLHHLIVLRARPNIGVDRVTSVIGRDARWPALLGAIFFLVHPLQTEPVIYIYQRATLLSGTFFLAALLLALQRHPSRSRQLILVLCVVGGLLSKEWTVVLPLLLWLERGLFWREWKPSPTLMSCLALSVMAAGRMVVWMSHDPTLGSGSSWEYARLQVLAWWKYLRLVVLPVGLSLDHPVPLAPAGGMILGAALTLGALIGGAIIICRRQSGALFALAIFLLALLPTSSIIPAQDAIFEHRLYAPLIGISILLGLLLARGLGVPSKPARGWAGILPKGVFLLCWVLFPTLVILTVSRSREWHSRESIWRAAVREAPEKYRPRLNLGRLLMSSTPRAAEVELVRAIELRPDLPHAFRSLASLRQRSGDSDSADDLLQQALLLEPGHAPTHLALGQLRMDQRHYFEAKQQFQQVIQLDPKEIRAFLSLANLEANFGFPIQSLAIVDQALAIWPRDLELLRRRADVLFRLARWPEASSAIRRALELGADDWQIMILAGQTYQKLEDFAQAESFLQRSEAAAESDNQRSVSERLLRDLRGK